MDRQGRTGMGSSIRMPIPVELMKLIHEGIELGHALDIAYGTKNIKQGRGFFGLMTNDTITRTTGYRDGLIVALGHVRHVHQLDLAVV